MFFDGLAQKELDILEKAGTIGRYSTGEYLIREGSPGTSFSLILSGSVEVRKNLTDKHSKAVTVLKECDFVGELGFFGAQSRSADVIALTDCETLEFEKEAFEKVTMSNPKLGVKVYRNIARILAGRLVNTDIELKESVVWSMEKEIARMSLPDIRQKHNLKIKKE
jgi:CRP/FNR family cyclic AMP-dependent transcriptional regulator